MDNSGNKLQQKEFDDFIHAIGSEIEQAQIKLVSAANVQMLLHYWKVGNFILFNQKKLGWGSKIIDRISKAIREKFPEKKGYSTRNLKYMCQFARLYPLDILKQLISADKELETPTIEKVTSVTTTLNKIGQEPPAQIQIANLEKNIIAQELPAQIQNITEALVVITRQDVTQIETNFIYSPVSKINWASHMILMDSKLPLGVRYWYMKQSVECGWSSNILNIQIDNNLFQRQIEKQKVNNFTAILPKPHSDLANYLLKDPYIFDLAGAKEQVDERDIEEQLVNHITKYLLDGNRFCFCRPSETFSNREQ